MKDITKYQGVIPAFYACYDAEGNISTEGVKALTRHLIAKGVKGVYVGGSSGECIYQHVDERKTVLENVMFPLDMFSTDIYRDRLKRARFCLDRVNLGEAQQKYPGEISGGMQKRVAIARAIALQPQYLFCDEPNSGLDPKTSLVIDELIHSITTEYNMTTIINTHDMNSVLGIGDSILFIYEGRQEWQGTKEEIFTSSNRRLNDFIFASDLLKKVKDMEMTTREG